MKRGFIFILLLMVFSVFSFGEKLAVLPELLRPRYLAIDSYAPQFYVGDRAVVYIYSLEDFSLKGKFGKAGEGPQEFLVYGGEGVAVFPQENHLLVNSFGKVSFFSKEGKYLKEFNTMAISMFGLFQPVGKGYAGFGFTQDEKTQSLTLTVNIYDDKFKKIKEIQKLPFIQRGSLRYPTVTPLFYTMDNKIIAPEGKKFILNIYDANGKKISSITHPYERPKVTDDYKKKIDHYLKTDPNTKGYYDMIKQMLKFDDYFPAIQFFAAADKKVYIQTYLETNGKWEFFIFDLEGKLLKRLFLPVAYLNPTTFHPYTFSRNKFYQLIENEDEEEWELHAIEIR